MAQVPSQKSKVGAERGKKLHGIVETYLETAPTLPGQTLMEFAEAEGLYEKDIRHGLRSASEGDLLMGLREMHHDPSVPLTLLVEQKIEMSPVFLGFVDLIVLDKRSGKLEVTIRDHKFSADKRYVPTEEMARTDFQTMIYAKSVAQFFSLDSVHFAYDYYGTKCKWQKKLEIDLTREFIDAKWLDVLGSTASVLDNYTVPCGANTTPNYVACQNFGGCEYKDLCFGEK